MKQHNSQFNFVVRPAVAFGVTVLIVAFAVGWVVAAEVAPAARPPQAAEGELATNEADLAARFKHFEEVLLRLAELTAADDPQQAVALRRAVAKSKERLIGLQFERVTELLRQSRLSVAIGNQTELSVDLQNLLDLLLSEDRAKRLESEQTRLRAYLKEVNRLIKEQQGIHSHTERGGEFSRLAERQGELAERTGKLSEQMQRDADAEKGDTDSKKTDDDQSGAPEPKADGDRPADDKQSPGGEKASPADAEKKTPGNDKPDGDKQNDNQGEGDDRDKKKPEGEPSESENKQSEPKSDSSGDPEKSSPDEQAPSQSAPAQPSPDEGESNRSSEEPSGANEAPQEQNPARKRVEAARERMREAREKLDKARREEAADKQAEALRELEEAKADLEKILRQLREEELARMLAMLKTRFQKMLAEQTVVYEGTLRLDGVPVASRGRNDEVESGRLSRAEAQIVIEADKALTLLREEGSAVALPEAVSNVREDMQQVAARLAEFKVDELTQNVEQDVIAALEEIIAALEKAQQQHEEEQKQQQSQPPPAGEPQEPPLIDKLAELRIIRALQMRINRRTQTYAKLIEGEQASQPDLLEALGQLAERQERIYRTTRDIAVGKNE